MAWFTEKICPAVVIKALYYLLETYDMYQHSNIHIDDTWLQQIHILNSENRIYRHNACRREDSVKETNMKITEADADNSDDEYSEADNNESSAADRDTILDSTATDMQSSTSTYTFALGEGKIAVFIEPLAEYVFFYTSVCGKVRPSNNDRLQKYAQVKYSNMNYM